MMPLRLGPNELLEYDAIYGVIICRECQYAIQKSALQSHLLRHKIFRNERTKLLASIAQLDILEPDNVPLPSPTSKPIEALPVVSGFRCLLTGCESLYASQKRMRRHQLESHNIFEADSSEPTVRQASLQTFFRGTKIRYFEVVTATNANHSCEDRGGSHVLTTSERGGSQNKSTGSHLWQQSDCSQPTAIINQCLPAIQGGFNITEEELSYGEDQLDVQMQGGYTTASPLLHQLPMSACNVSIDLQTLTYFHHFVSITSLTLPPANPKLFTSQYWQRDFIAQALQHRWLMAGLLALSASHLATLVNSASNAKAHKDRSVELYREYAKDRMANLHSTSDAISHDILTPPKPVLDQIDSILLCALFMSLGHTRDRRVTLKSLITPMCSLVTADITLRPSNIGRTSTSSQADAFGRAAHLLKMTRSNPTFAELLTRLNALPTRMAEAFGKPESIKDVIVALSAIVTLIDSCVAGFESQDVTFWAMVTWLSKAADEFHQMLSHDNPAALVVLAHWAASLVKQVEENGCWFLRGAADFITTQVVERLPANRPAIQRLIEGL